jgi:hypothetical protein
VNVVEKISQLIADQERVIHANIEESKTRTPFKLMNPFFDQVVRKISFYPLMKVEEEFSVAKSTDTFLACTGVFRKTMGIPCRREIKRKLNLGLILEINDFDSQWVMKHISLEHTESSLNPVERDYV